jgi:uncharacterized protein YbjT (DUF2867 family)
MAAERMGEPRTIRSVLLTGATGFVGSQLYGVLERKGLEVIGATRDPEAAQARNPGRAFRKLDVRDEATLRPALLGCDAAVYLVHSMADAGAYDDVEQRSAAAFARVASEVGLRRVVYLGGIEPAGKPSRHLQSRLRTGEALRSGAVPTIELQASMIIGAGSESFRIVRDLSARLPFMLLPSWLETRTQPIALDDVTAAVAHALRIDHERSAAYPLPGPEVMTCKAILEQTASHLGHAPRMWGVPLVSPHLSSYWITLVTRADKRVARELVEGLRSDLVAKDDGFWKLFTEHERLSFHEALIRALPEEERGLSKRAKLFERLIHGLAPSRSKPTRES